jgi:Spy/CpxP family protein refolding chaperone
VALVVAGVCVWIGAVAVARAQTPPPPGQQSRRAGGSAQAGGPAGAGQYSVAEVQQMFDALTLMQAEQALKLSDAQFPEFLSKLRALQQQRRRYQQQRRQVIQELVRLTGPAVTTVDDTAVREQLKALADLDQRAAADLRAAYEGIDQVLTVRQQARFRVLEEQLERRKFDLLARARRGALRAEPIPPKPIK